MKSWTAIVIVLKRLAKKLIALTSKQCRIHVGHKPVPEFLDAINVHAKRVQMIVTLEATRTVGINNLVDP